MILSVSKSLKNIRKLDTGKVQLKDRNGRVGIRHRKLRCVLDFARAFSIKGANNHKNPQLQTLKKERGVSRNASGNEDGNENSSETIDSGSQKMEQKIITIVFWDIQGFSVLCYSLEISPILLTLFLKDFFDAATQIVLRHGGLVDKFLGDGVMALFGTQSNSHRTIGNSASCAIKAALELKEQFMILRQKWLEIWQRYIPSQIDIGLKCGINTGYASVGTLGIKQYDYFTAFGINVNLSKRLADLSADNEIVISLTTRSKVFKQFELRRRGAVSTLKNIPGNFEAFSVIG
ncbi:MAG TPA: adenylate/guanylate cyclase domain-containing protein, partial [Nitrososphaeraceae archaeon]|nr:adenylate/guanylate cyclase domain-containing protein [Nitrososphaeraceae archaeon]